MSAPEPPPFPFDPHELGGLVEYLRDCPGRISAAAVPHAGVGDQLLERLRDMLEGLMVEEVGQRELPKPIDVGREAEERSGAAVVLALRLDRHSARKSMLEYFGGLNYQRERLARGQMRTLLVMTHDQAEEFGPGADDLWDWTLRFRFRGRMKVVTSAQLVVAANQLRRARVAGLDELVIARDYALPYFEAVVDAGHLAEAKRVWERELREGDACEGMSTADRHRCLQARSRMASDGRSTTRGSD